MLKMTTTNAKSKSKSKSSTTSFIGLAGGVFLFYIVHDAIQERLFRIEGFEFGSFMTVCELTAMALGSLVSGCCSSSNGGDDDDDKNNNNNRGNGGAVTKSSVTASAENKKKKKKKKRRDLLPPLNVLLLNFALVLLIALSQASGSQVSSLPFFLIVFLFL